MRVRTSDRNYPTLPLPMYEVGGIPNTNARTDRQQKRQPLLLSRRKSTIGPRAMETKYGGGPSDNQICNGLWTTRYTARPTNEYLAAVKTPLIPLNYLNPHHAPSCPQQVPLQSPNIGH